MLLRFKELYAKKLKSNLQEKFRYSNIHQIPSIQKIVINMGVGEAVADSNAMKFAKEDLARIAGQWPVVTRAKKSIATFKLRKGMEIGCKVTLRRDRMYDFLERLVLMALPRVKDFKGFSTRSFDKNGNLSFGIKEQIVFPEINYDKIKAVRGMDITIVTSAKTPAEAKSLLSGFSLPFYN